MDHVKLMNGKAVIELSSEELDEKRQKVADQLDVFEKRVAKLKAELAAMDEVKDSL